MSKVAGMQQQGLNRTDHVPLLDHDAAANKTDQTAFCGDVVRSFGARPSESAALAIRAGWKPGGGL